MTIELTGNADLNADQKIILAWMKEHNSPIVRRGDTTIFVAVEMFGTNLIELEADFSNMDDDAALNKVNEMLISYMETK